MSTKQDTNEIAGGGSALNVGLGVVIPDGYVLLPKKPSVELLEKFIGRGLMCGSKPHPDVYADAMRRYQRFLEYLTPNEKLTSPPSTEPKQSEDLWVQNKTQTK